ncbi:uncharacterized protein ACR2FA_007892 [Aphomia sociella]
MNSFSYMTFHSQDYSMSTDDPPQPVKPDGLPYFQASMFATVLEDTITELRILMECNNEMRLSKTMMDLNRLRALKYGVEQPAVADELENIDPKKLQCIEYKLRKLDADRKFFYDVLLETYLDLSLKRSYSALTAHVMCIVNRNNHRTNLLQEEIKNRALRRELYKQYRQQRNHTKSAAYDTDVAIEQLKTKVEDAALDAEIRNRYVRNWQNARTEQHQQIIRDKESRPTELIEYYKQKTDHEQRVHTEIELLITIAINEVLQKVEGWMNKYDKDMEAIDLKIQIMKNDHTNTREKRIRLEKTLEEHDRLIKNWVHFKDEREKARLYCEKMNNAAITVQAWWRGLLVRNQLGPYKPMPKKKEPSIKTVNVQDVEEYYKKETNAENEQCDELDGIDHHNLACIEYKLRKLESDRKYVVNAVMSMYVELALHNSFNCLIGFVEQIVNRNNHMTWLLEDEVKNKTIRRDLSKQLRQRRNHMKSVIYDTDAKIDDLKNRVEDSALYSECRSRYVQNWQRARTEQHIQTIKDTERSPSETIEFYKRRSEHEQRVHSEVELLMNIAINESLEKVENWMNKYDEDMEAIDLKIQIKKNHYQNMFDRRLDLEATIEKHSKLMREWNHFKEEREKARQYRDTMTKSAITVQAWWRGLLVRRQLGPYKVAKKKGAAVGKKNENCLLQEAMKTKIDKNKCGDNETEKKIAVFEGGPEF